MKQIKVCVLGLTLILGFVHAQSRKTEFAKSPSLRSQWLDPTGEFSYMNHGPDHLSPEIVSHTAFFSAFPWMEIVVYPLQDPLFDKMDAVPHELAPTLLVQRRLSFWHGLVDAYLYRRVYQGVETSPRLTLFRSSEDLKQALGAIRQHRGENGRPLNAYGDGRTHAWVPILPESVVNGNGNRPGAYQENTELLEDVSLSPNRHSLYIVDNEKRSDRVTQVAFALLEMHHARLQEGERLDADQMRWQKFLFAQVFNLELPTDMKVPISQIQPLNVLVCQLKEDHWPLKKSIQAWNEQAAAKARVARVLFKDNHLKDSLSFEAFENLFDDQPYDVEYDMIFETFKDDHEKMKDAYRLWHTQEDRTSLPFFHPPSVEVYDVCFNKHHTNARFGHHH